MQQLSGKRRRAAILLAAVLLFLTTTNVVLVAQNLGAVPQTNVAVQGHTGAQPKGVFLNLVNWIGNVIAPVGAARRSPRYQCTWRIIRRAVKRFGSSSSALFNILNGRGRGQSRFEPEGRGVPRFLSHSIRLT
jgi:hypothetical protein